MASLLFHTLIFGFHFLHLSSNVAHLNIIRRISNLWRGDKSNQIPPQGSIRKDGSGWFYPLNAGTFDDLELLSSFKEIPEVNAVIGLKARTFANGKIKVVNKEGVEIESHWASKLLNNPNWNQSNKEFLRQTKLFHEIYGNEYIYTNRPIGFNRPERIKALFTIPSNLVKVEFVSDFPFWTFDEFPKDAVKYILKNNAGTLPSENVIHMNDDRVSVKDTHQDKSILMGESKLEPLAAPINNIRMAYESRGVIIKYRGANGIISPDSKDAVGHIPLKDTDRKIIEETWQHDYGILMGQSQLAITTNPVKFQSMQLNEPKKLGLFEETKLDFFKIIDAFGCKREQFVMDDGATYENQDEANRAFYQDTCIPEANEWIAAFNSEWLSDRSEKLIIDFSHLAIFQENLKEKSEIVERMVNALSHAFQDGQIDDGTYKAELEKIGIGTVN